MDDQPEYEVGYQKPPKHTQWQPGQSGNPNGRPKKIKDFEKLLDIELSKEIRITDGGQEKIVTMREGIIKTLVHNAVKNDPRSLKLILEYMAKHQTVEDFQPDAADREALNQLIKEISSTEAEKNTGV